MTKKSRKKHVIKYREVSSGVYKSDHECPPHFWAEDKTSESGKWYCVFCDKSSYDPPDCEHCGLLAEDIVKEYPKGYDPKQERFTAICFIATETIEKLTRGLKHKKELDKFLLETLKKRYGKKFDPKRHHLSISRIEGYLDTTYERIYPTARH